MYFREWGLIDSFDGELYYIRIENGYDCIPVFERWQFRIPRK